VAPPSHRLIPFAPTLPNANFTWWSWSDCQMKIGLEFFDLHMRIRWSHMWIDRSDLPRVLITALPLASCPM
jgi:hypothetical protein